MSGNTKIEWATKVWNPVTGCTKVSEGCRNCYAERIAKRFWNGRPFSEVCCYEDRLNIPLDWKEPERVFVNSMSDLFHPDVPDGFIFGVFMRLAYCPRHTFIILTKRPERMRDWISNKWMKDTLRGETHEDLILDNVWLGVSVENQAAANERIPYLLRTPAAKRFVSCEPLLGAVSLEHVRPVGYEHRHIAALDGVTVIEGNESPNAFQDTNKLDWVICGSESGPAARPFNMDWARSLRNQCTFSQVPFFFKQAPDENGKLVKMPALDGEVWDEFPGSK